MRFEKIGSFLSKTRIRIDYSSISTDDAQFVSLNEKATFLIHKVKELRRACGMYVCLECGSLDKSPNDFILKGIKFDKALMIKVSWGLKLD
jgi:hypothetical protein